MRTIDYLCRSAFGCLCCGSPRLQREATVISPFLAKRGWNGKPELTWIMFCDACGFRFYDRGLSESDANRYYGNYRDESYLLERRHFEPFYTQREHDRLEAWMASKNRRVALSDVLKKAGAPERFQAALDFGGGTGKMLADIDAKEKAVFDVIADLPEKGVKRFSSLRELGSEWDLVLSCQVLEHLTDPFESVTIIANTMLEGGWFYTEVPPQIWRNPARNNWARNAFLRWLLKHPHLLLAGDIFSTALRIKCGFLPPFGFVPMREHLNYFTVDALSALVNRSGFQVCWSGTDLEGSICVVGKRLASTKILVA